LAVAQARLDAVESIRRREARMTTKNIDDTLAEIRRHIDELEARAETGAPQARARLQNRLDRLREEEASAWEAVREKAVAVDEKVRQLEIDIPGAEGVPSVVHRADIGDVDGRVLRH
jgi:uncharacterized protein YhaN